MLNKRYMTAILCPKWLVLNLEGFLRPAVISRRKLLPLARDTNRRGMPAACVDIKIGNGPILSPRSIGPTINSGAV